MIDDINKQIQIGDIIFIEVPNYMFQRVSEATDCWTNHVGWVHSHNGEEFMVAESSVPFCKLTPLGEFINRSSHQSVSIKRLNQTLDKKSIEAMQQITQEKLGKLYHLGFDYRSKRQFCSKFVYDIYRTALGIEIGELQSFKQLLETNPNTNLLFWKFWFFGFIPWSRTTITPASLYYSPKLKNVYEKIQTQWNIKLESC